MNYPDVKGRGRRFSRCIPATSLSGARRDLAVLARRTPYFTGADLMNVMNESALLTAQGQRESSR